MSQDPRHFCLADKRAFSLLSDKLRVLRVSHSPSTSSCRLQWPEEQACGCSCVTPAANVTSLPRMGRVVSLLPGKTRQGEKTAISGEGGFCSREGPGLGSAMSQGGDTVRVQQEGSKEHAHAPQRWRLSALTDACLTLPASGHRRG